MKTTDNKFDISVDWSTETGEIFSSIKTPMGDYIYDVIKTKDRLTRQALIDMGWTPPEGNQGE